MGCSNPPAKGDGDAPSGCSLSTKCRWDNVVRGSPRVAAHPTHLLNSKQVNSWRDCSADSSKALVVAEATHLDRLLVEVQPVNRAPLDAADAYFCGG